MEVIFIFCTLLLILGLIVFACVLFTNAIEHLGEDLNLSEGAIGSVFAAVGTALPETIVPLVAILGAYFAGGSMKEANEIGIGAILGAPFMLGTLAFFVTGLAVVFYAKKGKRSLDMPVNTVVMIRDLKYFAGSYLIAILSSFIPFQFAKHFVALLLIVMYGVYVFKTLREAAKESTEEAEIDELYFTKYLKFNPRMFALVSQLIVSLGGIIFLAHFFVEQLKHISIIVGINPLILSLIITPIATELPEKFNSVIWIRAKKDTLALGNITGAMVFQSCIPTAVGVALTPWVLNSEGLINVVVVYCSVFIVYWNIVSNKGVLKPSALLCGGLFYLIYLVYVLYKIFVH